MGSPITGPTGAIPKPAGEEPEQSIHQGANAKVPWPPVVWEAMHRAVYDETMRVQLAHKFLRVQQVNPKTTSVRPDVITSQVLPGDPPTSYTLTVDEGATIHLNEIWTEFALTTQQVHETAEAQNPEQTTAVMLAKHAAQYLAVAQDMVVFQGLNAHQTPFFLQNIRWPQGQIPADQGLLGAGSPGAGGDTLSVPSLASQNQVVPGTFGVTYGQNTLTQVAQGCSILAALGHSGEYALILNTFPYADLFAPVGAGSLVVTADRVAPLVKAGLFATGTLPPNTLLTSPPRSRPAGPYYGLLVDPVGDNMDLVVGLDATVVFMQQDPNENWRFRVLERSALRLKDPSAVVVVKFT